MAENEKITKAKKNILLPPEFYCVSCKRMHPNKNFSPNHNQYYKKYNFGRMSYCNSCAKEISQDIMSDYDNIELGLRTLCVFFGMPVVEKAILRIKEIYDARPNEPDWNWVMQYGAALKELNVPQEAWNNYIGNTLGFEETYRKLNESEFEILKELQSIWGDRTLQEYEFLENMWQRYTDGIKMSTAQHSLYRRLCISELEIRNKEKEKDSAKEAQKNLIELMSKLKLDQFMSNDKTLAEQMLESQIAYMEEEEPAFHYKDMEKFQDYRGIGKYFNDHITRPFKNLLTNSKDYKVLNEYVKKQKSGK